MAETKVFKKLTQQFADSYPKHFFFANFVQKHFPVLFYFQIFRKLTQNFPKNKLSRIFTKTFSRHFIYRPSMFSREF